MESRIGIKWFSASGDFGANGCGLKLACLSMNIIALTRRVLYGTGEWSWCWMKRIRAVMINIGGRLVDHAWDCLLVLSSAESGEVRKVMSRLAL